MLVNGLAPILAPLVGGELLHVTDWRGIFVVLAVIGAVLLLAAWTMLAETLAPDARHGGGLASTVRVFGRLVGDREYMGYALALGLAFGAMAAYIGGSPFVLQDIYGASPQVFSLLFALNAAGIVVASQVGRAVVDRYGPRTLLDVGVSMSAVGGLGALASVLLDTGLPTLLPSFFLLVSCIGLVFPNATALALADHPRTAGSASAGLGLSQFAIGAVAAPLAGVGGAETALPLGIVAAVLSVGSLVSLFVLSGRARRPASRPSVRAGA
jgi:DHA1 family bicyclomycin/chloramphenicol resistance-like MFS transporter